MIALARTPFLSPRYAQFRVPLNFNKLDLRDYLQNAYNVGVVSVRSYIEQQPITRMTRDGRNIGAWRRPKAQKRMTVELREPFVYPEEPKDLSPYVTDSDAHVRIDGCLVQIPSYSLWAVNARDCFEFSANLWFALSIDGRRNPGMLVRSGKLVCRRRCSKSRTAPRSPIQMCARPLKSRPRSSRRLLRSGDRRQRRWAWISHAGYPSGQERRRRNKSAHNGLLWLTFACHLYCYLHRVRRVLYHHEFALQFT